MINPENAHILATHTEYVFNASLIPLTKAPKYSEVGCLLFFAFAAASVLTKLGLQEEFTAVFNSLGNYKLSFSYISLLYAPTIGKNPSIMRMAISTTGSA